MKYVGMVNEERLTDFFYYWSETDRQGRMRFERQKYWDTESRLRRWMRNQFSKEIAAAALRLEKAKTVKARQAASIQIQSRGESYEALATALGHIVLKFLTLQVNILLAAVALVCLFSWLITEQHSTVSIFAIVAWVFHLAVMLTVDIAKGGAEL